MTEKMSDATDSLLQSEMDKPSDSNPKKSNKKLRIINEDGRRRTCEGHEEAAKLLCPQGGMEKQASDSDLQTRLFVMNHQKSRKLSESRGIKLPLLATKGPERSQSAAPGIDPAFTMDEYSPITQIMRDFANVNQERSTYSQSFNLLPINSNLTEPTLEVLDIRIFFSDGKSVQFTIEGGKEAEVTDLLFLIAEYFGVPEEIVKEVFSLWLISPLFEVQLKPHHVAAEVRHKWPLFLKKFTYANEDDIALDEPLLVLRRNVSLSIDTERMYQKDYEKIVELLYLDARDQYLNGRYLVNVEETLELAALQMAIDYEPYEEGKDDEAFSLVRDKLSEFVPAQHLSKIRSFQLFGLSVMECKHGLETQVVQNFKDFSAKFGSKNDRRIAYLDILRSTPFYGAAFFDGQTEKRTTSIFLEYSRRLFTGATPLARMNVRIGIQYDFITVVDVSKMEVLLTQRVGDCSWLKSESEQTFFLHFPDPKAVNEKSVISENTEPPSSKLLQIFSKQSVMMKALLDNLDEIAASKIGSANDLIFARSLSIPSPTDGSTVAFSYSSGSDSGHSNGQVTTSESSKVSNHSYGQSGENPNLNKVAMKTGFDQSSINNNKLSRLCLATLDPKGCCIEAHGTLRKIFVPVH